MWRFLARFIHALLDVVGWLVRLLPEGEQPEPLPDGHCGRCGGAGAVRFSGAVLTCGYCKGSGWAS